MLNTLSRVMWAEARRIVRTNVRFKLEFFGTLFALYGAFFLLEWVGARYSVPYLAFGTAPRNEVVLYAVWMWSYSIIGGATSLVVSDLATGACEPFLAGKKSGLALTAGRILGFSLQNLVVCSVLVVVVFAGTSSRSTGFAAGWIVVAGLVALLTSVGFALLFSGLVLVFRRVSVLMAPISILVMWAMLSPGVDTSLADLPYFASRILVQAAFTGDVGLPIALRGALSSACVLLVGSLGYVWLERRARKTGKLCLA